MWKRWKNYFRDKQKYAVGALLGLLFTNFVWNPFALVLGLNLERATEKYGYDKIFVNILDSCQSGAADCGRSMLDALLQFGLFVTGDFGLGFGVGAVVFSFWDPVATWIRRRKQSLSIHPQFVWRTGPAKEVDGEYYYANWLALCVTNTDKKNRTIRNIRAQMLSLLNQRDQLLTANGANEVTLNHGETAEFLTGYILLKRDLGFMQSGAPNNSLVDFRHAENVKRGFFSFCYQNSATSLNHSDPPTAELRNITISVSGENAEARNVRIKIPPEVYQTTKGRIYKAEVIELE